MLMQNLIFNGAGIRLVLVILTLVWSGVPSVAQSKSAAIDVEHSSMTIHVSKSGLFSFAGDNHEIHAPIASGTVNEAAQTVELRVESAKLTVLDPNLSESKRAQVQQEMTGPHVLDAGRFPEISFRSTHISQDKPSTWQVTGDLTLHGQTRSITMHVNGRGGRYHGTATLKQTDFGITPISIAGGAVKVKDEVAIDFDVVTRQ
jgi:polyisoprenoid-binding protein YceI